jgi:phage repressor protein C with HTH and peptisase S24 domain
MNLAERIQTVLDEVEGLDQVKLGEAAGVTKGTVNQWLSGQIKSLKLEYAVGIQERYGYNAVWLVMDKGEKKVKITHSSDPFDPVPLPPGKRIPVVGMASLGDNGFWADLEYIQGHGDGYLDFPSQDPNAYSIRCKGDSMQPRIKDGEFVVIEPAHIVEPGDEVLVKARDGRVMVKTFLYERAGRTHLSSVNENHAPIIIEKEQIEKMHYVGAIVKNAYWRHG